MRVPCLKVSLIGAENKQEMRGTHVNRGECPGKARVAEVELWSSGSDKMLLSERDASGPRKGLQVPLIQSNLRAPSFSLNADSGR
jgi:hypothetical protein